MAELQEPTAPDILSEDISQLKLARQQALKYGQDLARVYVAEKTKREELEIAYQALSAIFASTPDSLIVLDDAFVIQQVNPAFEHLVEQTTEAVVGQPVSDVLASYELLRTLQRHAIDETTPSQVEITITQPTHSSLLINIARLKAGSTRGWIVVLHDQTRLKRMENQKAEFINIASHELRTPLTAMMGYSQLLLDEWQDNPGGIDPAHMNYLESIARGGTRLKGIIDEIVEFASLNRGDVQPSGIVTFRLPDLIDGVVSQLRSHADTKQVALRILADDPDLEMMANAALLKTALNQLVLNGINFNQPGGAVTIEIAAEQKQVRLYIRDTGVGIPQAELDTIFQPFFQVEDHNTRSVDGLGLGLPIVRRAIELLGGAVSVESSLGEGTSFTILLPRQQVTVEGDALDLRTQLESTRKQSLVYARDMMTLYRQVQQTNRQLQELNVQLEEADKLKSNFLGVIGHELRSPFVSIDFALQALMRYGLDNLNVDQRDLVRQLKQGCQDAREMVDKLVSVAGLLSKQGKLNLEIVDIVPVIQDIVTTLEPMARSRQLLLDVQIPPQLMLLAGDRERISEAIWHLTHNAIKFTKPGGHITIQSHIENEVMFIAVRDTGVGIPVEQQARMWESFAQLSDSVQRGMEGLGLGLALVRYVAAAHSGDVVLQSNPGVGQCHRFLVTDPLPTRRRDCVGEFYDIPISRTGCGSNPI